MQDFKKLVVWQKTHALTVEVYRQTTGFPKDEVFGLTSQIRRAASSIGANIAEGCGRSSNAELNRYLNISAGSASELENHLLLSRDLGYLPEDEYDKLFQSTVEIKQMLSGLIKKLNTKL